MTIILYDDKYKEDLKALVGEFFESILRVYSTEIDIDIVLKNVEANRQTVFLMLIDGKCEGALGGITTSYTFNNTQVFQEMLFYVNEGYRYHIPKFIDGVQRMLRGMGFKVMVMSYLHDFKSNGLLKLYERMGFKTIETHVMRNL